MKLSEAVGKRVENLLAERNMTQYQLYKNGGIPRSTISVTVDGKYKTVKLDTIYQIVATLGITLKDFFDDALFDDLEDWWIVWRVILGINDNKMYAVSWFEIAFFVLPAINY